MNFSQLNFINQIKKSKDEKRARWLTLILLLLTVGLSLGFGLISYVRENGVELPFSLVKPNLDLLIRTKPKMSARLNQWAEHELTNLPGQWGVKVKFLNSGRVWNYQAEQQMTAASLIKLPVVAAFYQQVESGEYDLADTYTLVSEDKHSDGQLVDWEVGTEITWRRILELAFSHSDKTAFRILRKELGDELINRKINDWGMEETDLDENLTSADDICLFFEKLYNQELVDETYQQMMIEDLINTTYEEQIPAGIPEGIQVAHKVGYEEKVVSDAGIIFVPDNPLIMVIMSQETSVSQAKNTFPRLVKEIYWQAIED